MSNEHTSTHVIDIITILPAIFGGDELLLWVNLKWQQTGEVNLASMMQALSIEIVSVNFMEKDQLVVNNPYNGAIVVTVLIINYQIGSILITTRSTIKIIFKSVCVNFKICTHKKLSL